MCLVNVLTLSKELAPTFYKQWPEELELFSLEKTGLVGEHGAAVVVGSLSVSQGMDAPCG